MNGFSYRCFGYQFFCLHNRRIFQSSEVYYLLINKEFLYTWWRDNWSPNEKIILSKSLSKIYPQWVRSKNVNESNNCGSLVTNLTRSFFFVSSHFPLLLVFTPLTLASPSPFSFSTDSSFLFSSESLLVSFLLPSVYDLITVSMKI